MYDPDKEIAQALELLERKLVKPFPQVAVILGSGLGAVVEQGLSRMEIRYEDLPGMPKPAVEGHVGTLCQIALSGVELLFFSGRSHYYEGHDPCRLGMSVRIAAAAGVKTVISTCAAGSLNPSIRSSDLVIVTDHINMSGINPLVGVKVASPEQRFPDTSNLYESRLRMLAIEKARELGIKMNSGVYAWVSGPSYETPAESRMLRMAGADVIGMSMVPEALTAAQLGLRFLAIACITNMAPGIGKLPPSHAAVLSESKNFITPLSNLIQRISTSCL